MAVQEKQGFLTKRLVITSILAGLLLIIVNSAIWVNTQIFNTENFTSTAVSSLSSESSRRAIGARITDEALKDRPVLKNIVGDHATNLISGLLATDQANKLLTASVSRMQVYVTSNNQQDVDIDLSGLKSILTRVVELSGSEQAEKIDPDRIPEKIVLIEEENVPDIYMYGVILSWVAPLGLLLALGLIAAAYFADRKRYSSIMIVHGVTLVSAGLLSLLIGPLFKPPVLEPFSNPNGRIVIGNLYDAFIATFNAQTVWLIYLGLLVFVAVAIIRLYPQLKKLRR